MKSKLGPWTLYFANITEHSNLNSIERQLNGSGVYTNFSHSIQSQGSNSSCKIRDGLKVETKMQK